MSHQKVSGLKWLTSGERSAELPGKSGELPGNLWMALRVHSERSAGGKSPTNFWGSLVGESPSTITTMNCTSGRTSG